MVLLAMVNMFLLLFGFLHGLRNQKPDDRSETALAFDRLTQSRKG